MINFDEELAKSECKPNTGCGTMQGCVCALAGDMVAEIGNLRSYHAAKISENEGLIQELEIVRKGADRWIVENKSLRNQLVKAKAMAQFVKWAMRDGPWDGGDLDGGAVQDKAAGLGLLQETIYDPEKHGEDEWCEPGDRYYVLDPIISSLSDETSK